MRIHELAKELGLASKEVIAQAQAQGMAVKNHMSSLGADDVEALRKALGSAVQPPAPAAAPEIAEAAQPAEASQPEQEAPATEPEAPAEEVKKIVLKGPVVVKDLAETLGLKPNQLIAQLMGLNVFASLNQTIELPVARKLAAQHGWEVEEEVKRPPPPPPPKAKEPPPPPPVAEERKPKKKKVRAERKPAEMPDSAPSPEQISRPPIVTFMGHVDHGKTSLLDRIRDTRVAAGEDGGITQHIGAYTAAVGDRSITFLDTPGHAAFTAMRARGANLTDIAVIVIAADDGIMPQTREAIQHARAAGVCIMVAINKIDMRGANVDRVKQQLQEEDLLPEDWGGDTICCPVSAETGEGMEHLLEMIVLQAEVLELKCDPGRAASGYIVEARMEPGRGPTATLLVRDGTLHVGDAVVCGACWGRIKALINDQGIKVRTAGPSSAVQCIGLTDVPEAGAEFVVYPKENEARAVAEERRLAARSEQLNAPQRASLEDFMRMSAGDEPRELALLVKADFKGSLEAILQALGEIPSGKIRLKFPLQGVGNISTNDVLLASASNAIVVGFHVGLENNVQAQARHEGVEIRLYSVIYELIDDVRQAMTGLLEPITKEQVIGHAEVRQLFQIGKRSQVAGCMVSDGRAQANAAVRVKRGEDVLFEGRVASLKRFQNDASEIRAGQECGIRLDRFSSFEVGDTIEFYVIEKITPEL